MKECTTHQYGPAVYQAGWKLNPKEYGEKALYLVCMRKCKICGLNLSQSVTLRPGDIINVIEK